MVMRASVLVVLILATVPLIFWSPIVNGQASPITSSNSILIASLASVKPRIDGFWRTGEWNGTDEYRLSSPSHDVNGKGEVYARFKYDESLLYTLVDVPSDDGSILPTNQSGQLYFALDLNMNGLTTDRLSDVDVLVNTYYNVTTNVSGCLFSEPSWFSEINATQRLGVSPHSGKPHRIYEISLPLQKVFQYGLLSYPENQPAIYVYINVSDSHGNDLMLLPSRQLSKLELPIPVTVERVTENSTYSTSTLSSLPVNTGTLDNAWISRLVFVFIILCLVVLVGIIANLILDAVSPTTSLLRTYRSYAKPCGSDYDNRTSNTHMSENRGDAQYCCGNESSVVGPEFETPLGQSNCVQRVAGVFV
jgi:hypothetical protein